MDAALAENRWMPPSPHREQVLKEIEAGRAFIRERGHNVPPLLVFGGEGGVIELPKVRYKKTRRGMQLIADADSSDSGQTRHPDVCGSVDEFKGLLAEQPELARTDPALLLQLLDDACYMIGRMHRRRETYAKFAKTVAELCQNIESAPAPEVDAATTNADQLRDVLRDAPETVPARTDELAQLAEGIRDVANALEDALRTCRKASMPILGLIDELRGGRNWS